MINGQPLSQVEKNAEAGKLSAFRRKSSTSLILEFL
jgi:hypothetical protein